MCIRQRHGRYLSKSVLTSADEQGKAASQHILTDAGCVEMSTLKTEVLSVIGELARRQVEFASLQKQLHFSALCECEFISSAR